MKLTSITPILNVSDVPASVAWFQALGWRLCFAWNDGGMINDHTLTANEHGPANFAGVGAGECEIFLCRDGQGARGRMPTHADDDATGGVWMSWWLKTPREVDEVYELAKQHGVTIAMPPTDEPWNVRECKIVHPDGHTFRVSAPMRCE
jgi:uncharacterized glyoxalase superfamily protein PhnB